MSNYNERLLILHSRCFQKCHYLITCLRIKISSRLVCQDNGGLRCQCSGNRHSLLLTSRQCVRKIIQLLAQSKQFNNFFQINHTSICVERGDFVTIVGKSGSGKSTLLHLIGGLDYHTSGEVWIDNECITNMNEEDLSAFRRRKIGFIFQAFNLVPSLNVWENIILPIGLDDRSITGTLQNSLPLYNKRPEFLRPLISS